MLLVIAATPQELAGAAGARTLVCGIGPRRPTPPPRTRSRRAGADAVLHVGIAGARRGSGVPLLATVIGTQAVDCDGDSEPIVPVRQALLAAARRALPEALALPIGTSARVGGTSGVEVEAMEGFAVLAACRDEGVPALEMRVISNEIEEPDRALWRFDDALAELARVTALADRGDRPRHERLFGFSPCPNDTFAFDALVHGRIPRPSRPTPRCIDIEELNALARTRPLRAHEALDRRARRRRATATRCCAAAAALGHGCGPLVVAREAATLATRRSGASRSPAGTRPRTCCCGWRRRRSARSSSCATTRSSTRSQRSGRRRADHPREPLHLRAHGLVEVADLGAWWERETGLPVPLAGICARADLDDELRAGAEDAMRRSVEHAFAHPNDSLEYVRAHSQELSDEVCRQHIELYVNEFTRDLGDDGMAAIDALLARAAGTPA